MTFGKLRETANMPLQAVDYGFNSMWERNNQGVKLSAASQ